MDERLVSSDGDREGQQLPVAWFQGSKSKDHLKTLGLKRKADIAIRIWVEQYPGPKKLVTAGAR